MSGIEPGIEPGCDYCDGLRCPCACETDCGVRGSHTCQKAPADVLAEYRAWVDSLWKPAPAPDDAEAERIAETYADAAGQARP